MRKTPYLLAAAALVAAPVAQAQDGVTVFKPTGGWTADYGEDYCRLIRTFSDGKDEVSLALQRTQPGLPLRLILVGNGIKTFRGADQIGYQFLPTGSAARFRYVRAETADGRQYLNFDPVMLAPLSFTATSGSLTVVQRTSSFPAPPPGERAAESASAPGPLPLYDRVAEQEVARGITALSLAEGLSEPVRFETGSLKAPVGALQTCADDLLKVWGIDPEKHKAMTAVANLNPVSDGVVPLGTIPFSEFGKLNGGANEVRLIVGADGKPSSCTIHSPSLSQSINDRICSAVMSKATFEPAKDANGAPMASFWMGSPLFLGPRPSGPGR